MKNPHTLWLSRFVKSCSLLFALLLLIFHSIPAQAFLDRWSEEQIQFIDSSACDPTGQFSTMAPPSSDSSGSASIAGTGSLDKEVGASEFTDAKGYKSDSLTGTYSYAELSKNASDKDFTALGGLKYKQKLAITYKGKTVVAEKLDIGAGGGDVAGKSRDIDLIYDKTAKALGVTSATSWTGVVGVKTVADSTPLGPVTDSGATTTTTSDGATTNTADQTVSACACGASSSNDISLVGNQNAEKAFNFFVSAGYTKEQAAGIVGNFLVESGVEPQRQQGTPPGTKTPADSWSGNGWGIAQWTPGSKLINPLKAAGKDPNDLLVQLQVVADGLKGKAPLPEPAAGKQLKNTKTVEQATSTFELAYERPKTPGATIADRTAKAKATLEKYGSGASSSASDVSGSVAVSSGCSGNSGGSNGSGQVNSDGYSWPIDLTKSEVTNWGSPWCRHGCHHDGTPAMDITKKGFGDSVAGTAEFAIIDGTISNLHIYNGISGCYSLQLIGSDGWHYYYTHFRSPAVQSGDKVKAGQKTGEVGERKCTGNGSDPHLHIDRGSPKGHVGGQECCRDPGFEDLMDSLYDQLK